MDDPTTAAHLLYPEKKFAKNLALKLLESFLEIFVSFQGLLYG